MERQEAAAQRIAERLRRALARDAAGALAPLPFPLQPNLTPRRLPSLEPVDLNPPVEGTQRVAAVTALVVPPVALGACGPNGGDELNILKAGANYGWPLVSMGRNYSGTLVSEQSWYREGMEQPRMYWVPSISPAGMAFYTGGKFPKWRGDLFVGALKDQMLVRLKLDGEKVVREERLLKNALGRIRDVRMGPDGFIYLLTDEPNGVLARVELAE